MRPPAALPKKPEQALPPRPISRHSSPCLLADQGVVEDEAEDTYCRLNRSEPSVPQVTPRRSSVTEQSTPDLPPLPARRQRTFARSAAIPVAPPRQQSMPNLPIGGSLPSMNRSRASSDGAPMMPQDVSSPIDGLGSRLQEFDSGISMLMPKAANRVDRRGERRCLKMPSTNKSSA